ncbi:MAG: chromate efflux transporter [Planctomycetes bacterium]|nr:chromate efflux transporter [Planctomycetota bacterium]
MSRIAEQNQPGTRVPTVRLFLAFLRLGSTAFGGPTMVAYIRDLAVKKNQWLSQETFEDGAALCQSIPGATAMQAAAYTGLRAGGPLGALAAFVGFGLPAFVLMVGLSVAYQAGRDLQPVLAAFHGLRVIVIAIVANAALNFGRSSIRNGRDAILAAGAAVFLVLHGSPILAIVASAGLSILLYQGVDLPTRTSIASSPESGRRTLAFAGMLALLFAAGLVVLYAWERPLFDLATLMLKVDLFAFGGGFASVPLMLHEVVGVRHWLDSRTFMDGIALGQVTPGPIVITATFVGYQVAGVLGALVGTIGIFTPSFLMVLVTVPYFDRLQHSVSFRRALRGVLASFVGLLVAVAIHFGIAVSWSIPAVALALAALAALRLKVDILWVVLMGAAVATLTL